jgi:hypothetical protein
MHPFRSEYHKNANACLIPHHFPVSFIVLNISQIPPLKLDHFDNLVFELPKQKTHLMVRDEENLQSNFLANRIAKGDRICLFLF